MLCCECCFNDSELKAIIKSKRQFGKCDFCSDGNRVAVYDLNKYTEIHELFEGLLDIFSTKSSLPSNYPEQKLDYISNILTKRWGLIKHDKKKTNQLLSAICSEKKNLFKVLVGIPEANDTTYLNNFSLVKTADWDEFIGELRHTNRFHTSYINTNIFDLFLPLITKYYTKGTELYRARICAKKNEIIDKKEMGAPPVNKATSGRANSEGIPCLYLANSPDTTLYEIRASVHDSVTVGKFVIKQSLNVINLTLIDKISPFLVNDFVKYAINIEHLKLIAKEIARPLRRNDSQLDYLPTQYVSDYIKRSGYDGIEYISTMCPDGFNLAIFNTASCKCVKTELFTIKSINYTYLKA